MTAELDYNTVEILYGGKRTLLTEGSKIIIKTFNEVIFGSILIILSKKTKVFGLFTRQKRLAGASIRIRDILANTQGNHDLIDCSSLFSAEYFEKDMILYGRIRLHFTVDPLNEALKDGESIPFVKKIINKLLSAELNESFTSIDALRPFLLHGNNICNIKSFIGMFIMDGLLLKKMSCVESDHVEMSGCFRKNCVQGYTLRPPEEALLALRCINYCVGSYLDSRMWQLLITPARKCPEIKDSKLRGAVERLDIDPENFIRYFEGSHSKIGFIVLVDEDSLVVSFRGTLSALDVINDLNASYVPFQDGYSHSGMVKLAETFIDQELDELTMTLESRGLCKMLFTGHSLGGGVASLVHLMAIVDKRLEGCELKTITFASPPTVSDVLLHRNVPNIVTYNYGNDIIPRLSIGSLLDFKYLCLSLANIYEPFLDSKQCLEKIVQVRKYLKETDKYPKLYHPGTVYHIKDDGAVNQPQYGFKEVDARFFADLVCFKDFPIDHILRKHIQAFNKCVEHDTVTD